MSEIGDLTNSSGTFDRRRFLQRVGRGALGVGMAGAAPTVFAACGGEDEAQGQDGGDLHAAESIPRPGAAQAMP